MKTIFLFILSFSFSVLYAQTGTIDSTKKVLLVDASCGQCKLGLKGNGCDLAVRIDGKSWFVDGTDIDSHGDSHADDGFCNAIRKAEVQGELVGDRFKVSYFKLVKEKAKKE